MCQAEREERKINFDKKERTRPRRPFPLRNLPFIAAAFYEIHFRFMFVGFTPILFGCPSVKHLTPFKVLLLLGNIGKKSTTYLENK